MYEIEFYEDENGKSVIADFIKELNIKAATNKECRINFNKIAAYMDMLEELGTRVGEPVTKHLDGDVSTGLFGKEGENMTTWKEVKKDLTISKEDQNAIELEKDIIRTMVAIREEKGLTQSQLAQMCNVKQPVIARMESSVHSPQIDSLLKILTPLGYTLQIVPMGKKYNYR